MYFVVITVLICVIISTLKLFFYTVALFITRFSKKITSERMRLKEALWVSVMVSLRLRGALWGGRYGLVLRSIDLPAPSIDRPTASFYRPAYLGGGRCVSRCLHHARPCLLARLLARMYGSRLCYHLLTYLSRKSQSPMNSGH